MVVRCVKCGRIVSNEIPDSVKLGLKAWVECHHCVNNEVFSDRVVFQQLTMHGIQIKLFEFFMKCKFRGIDLASLKTMMIELMQKAIESKFTKEGYFEKLRNDSDKLTIMENQKKAG